MRVVWEGLPDSWLSMFGVTEAPTLREGLVRSDNVDAGPVGVSAALSVDAGALREGPSTLSPPPFSCRKRFLLNFARAFWNQTCKPIPGHSFYRLILSFPDFLLGVLTYLFINFYYTNSMRNNYWIQYSHLHSQHILLCLLKLNN